MIPQANRHRQWARRVSLLAAIFLFDRVKNLMGTASKFQTIVGGCLFHFLSQSWSFSKSLYICAPVPAVGANATLSPWLRRFSYNPHLHIRSIPNVEKTGTFGPVDLDVLTCHIYMLLGTSGCSYMTHTHDMSGAFSYRPRSSECLDISQTRSLKYRLYFPLKQSL
jgi:hypothetical protein